MIYLDYSATTPVLPEVLNSYNKVTIDYFGNPNSMHSLGVKSHELLTSATKQISKILNIECIVKDVTNGNEHWKRPLLIENIKLILRINVENRIDEYSIYFKYNEDCYDKISEIKFNITTAFAKTIKGNPKIEGNKVITKNRIYVFNINGICNDNCNIEVYSNKPDIAIKYNVRSITTLQGHQYLVSENGKTIPTK